jgi:serine/threonine-protein kinase
VGEIGRGAFGTVYRAHDPSLQLDIALKVIRPVHPDAPFDADKALSEARRLVKINHRNVVRVFRAERVGDEVGMSMELVAGETLDEIVQRQGPVSANEATLIGLELCRALAAVHGSDTLHGDIKAHNVMRGNGGRIVLMDFGTSKDLSRNQRRLGGDFAGTPLYLAPEVFDGAPRTKASDVYSLGVLLYYLVSGMYPVDGSTRSEIGRNLKAPGVRRPLRDARPDLPDAFVRVVEQALAEAPQSRYASAGTFEAALESVLSRPAPEPSPPADWKKRLKLAAVGVAIVAGALLYRAVNPTRTATPDQPTAIAPSSAAPIAPVAPGTYRVNAAIYREEKGSEVRLQPDARVAPGESLSLRVQTSVPSYVYVVNEDEQGESYLLFPLPGQSLTNPLAGGERHRLPGTDGAEQISWQVSSVGGREHFLIFVSPERSPAFERTFASLPTPSRGKPIVPVRLSQEDLGTLRGVGGLTAAPVKADQGLRKAPEYSTPLPLGEETTSGLWVRQIAFENPGGSR